MRRLARFVDLLVMRYRRKRCICLSSFVITWLFFMSIISQVNQNRTKNLSSHEEDLSTSPQHYVQHSEHGRLLPGSDEVNDRILGQINYRVADVGKTLVIGLYPTVPADIKNGSDQLHIDKCQVKNCKFIDANKDNFNKSDVILWLGIAKRRLPVKLDHQLWGLFVLESPENSYGVHGLTDRINFTATYRRDSTIVSPYNKYVAFDNSTTSSHAPLKDYARGKSKMVAWFVSNCAAINGRLQYANALRKHVDVDIYGVCGKYKCPRNNQSHCFQKLKADYKFYLSFENSNCKDYITEKFFGNALENDVVPVVMGARPEDYAAVAPPHSYIHVDDFESPRHLAEYLKLLDSDDALYNEYHAWRGRGQFILTKFWCRLCAMVNHMQTVASWYQDVDTWWWGNDDNRVCVPYTKGRAWMSWKGFI